MNTSSHAQHGTLTAYHIHKCRCDPCTSNARHHQKQYKYHVHQHGKILVDAQPIRDHVKQLQAAGMSFNAITKAAGYRSRNSLATVLQRTNVHPRTRDRILAVTPESDTRPSAYVDATRSRQQLQALATLGWSGRQLAGQSPLSRDTIEDIRNGTVTRIRQHTSQHINTIYEQLWDTTGTSARTRAYARRNGYPAPMDLEANEEAQAPSPECITCLDIEFLIAAGESWERISQRLGYRGDAARDHHRRHTNSSSLQAAS